MITLSGVGRSHGQRVLFRDVSLQILPSHRMAVVGPNGAGKTTLLEIIAGTHPPDAGEVVRARGVEAGFLRQEVAETAGRSVLDEVMSGAAHVTGLDERLRSLETEIAASEPGPEQDALLAEYGHAQHRFEHLGGYTLDSDARRVLAGLGFDEVVVDRDVGELSGGWMMRVALARLLLAEPDVLLLDEPTNHLDLASVTWLEGFLAAYTGAIVLVSHDRDFINAVANRVIEISRGTTTEYVGDYAAFVEQRELRQSQLVAASRNQQRKIEQTERFIERFRYKNTKAKQVQSRIKSLEKLERVEVQPRSTKTMRFKLPPPPRAGREVVRLADVVKRYGDNVVYDGLDFVLERELKVALVGPNGAGKSTLLKILAGVLPIEAGTRTLGHNVEVAYYAQHQIDALHLERTVLQELSSAVDTSKVNPRSILGAFMFPGDDVDKRVGILSGGEKARLALAKLLARPVNLLCMDEPTNHLDIGSRDVVEDALLEYPGTVVLITHDRHLIRSVADTIVEVRDGGVTVYPGSYEDYEWRTGGGLDGQVTTPAPTPRVAQPRQRDDQRAARKRAEAEARNRRSRETRDLRGRLRQVEAALGAVEHEVAELTRVLADPATYEDGERVKALVAQHGAAKDRAVDLTREWERLYEQVERASAAAGN